MSKTGTIECDCGGAITYELGIEQVKNPVITGDRNSQYYPREYLKTRLASCAQCGSFFKLEMLMGGVQAIRAGKK
jgi:hypothetical protein